MKHNGTYRCAAGITHHERLSVIDRWKREEAERVAGDVADKVRAHDDYQDAVRLFRERIPSNDDSAVMHGYMQAVKDMDRAMMDVLRSRHDES